jgi:BASS family bile acid:Na+ symporter
MLVLPLVLGIYLNVAQARIAARLRKPLQYLSMAIFIAVVVLALAANWALFLQYASAVAALVLLHNALALATGFGVASLAGLSAYDRRAVTIETGIQNSGLGLVLIFGFFDGLGGMAVVAAFWGIWHIISGILFATVVGRTKVAPTTPAPS